MNFDNTSPAAGMPHHQPSYYYLYKRARPYLYAPSPTYRTARSPRYEPLGCATDPARSSIDAGPQTVEDLVQQGYFAVPVRNVETAVLRDQQDTAWLALDDTLTQLRERFEIYRQNMLELEWGKCYAFNELARHGYPPSEEQHALYQRRLHDLQSEQRLERVRLWSDVSRVRQLVPPSAQQYLSSLRKNQILSLDEGDEL